MCAKPAWTVEQFFEGRPKSLELFNEIRHYLESLGPVRTEAAKTQVSFGMKNKFAWVWLPQKWVKTLPKDSQSVTVRFDVARQITHRRIIKAIKTRFGSWTHEVLVDKASDLDKDVRGWLRESYLFSQA